MAEGRSAGRGKKLPRKAGCFQERKFSSFTRLSLDVVVLLGRCDRHIPALRAAEWASSESRGAAWFLAGGTQRRQCEELDDCTTQPKG